MSNEVLQAARVLIEAKKYDEARMLLKTIDHPTATKWLAKLDEVAPRPQSKVQKPKTGMLLTIGLAAVFVVLLGVFVLILTTRNTDPPTTDTASVVVNAPTLVPQSTSIPIALQNTPIPSTESSSIGTRSNPNAIPSTEPIINSSSRTQEDEALLEQAVQDIDEYCIEFMRRTFSRPFDASEMCDTFSLAMSITDADVLIECQKLVRVIHNSAGYKRCLADRYTRLNFDP